MSLIEREKLYESKGKWSETSSQILSQLPYMQEEQTHYKAMQLDHQITCMYRLKIYATYFISITTLLALIRSRSKFKCNNGHIN